MEWLNRGMRGRAVIFAMAGFVFLGVLVATGTGVKDWVQLKRLSRGEQRGESRIGGVSSEKRRFTPVTARLLLRRTGRLSGIAQYQQVALVIRELNSLLKAGIPEGEAWQQLQRLYRKEVATSPELFPVVSAAIAAQSGSSVSRALVDSVPRADNISSSTENTVLIGEAWKAVAAFWQVSLQSGASLSVVFQRLADQVVFDVEIQQERQVALAGPWMTAQLLTWLPLGGLGLGFVLGLNPVGIVIQHPLAQVSCLFGLVLVVLSRVWSKKLVANVVESGLSYHRPGNETGKNEAHGVGVDYNSESGTVSYSWAIAKSWRKQRW